MAEAGSKAALATNSVRVRRDMARGAASVGPCPAGGKSGGKPWNPGGGRDHADIEGPRRGHLAAGGQQAPIADRREAGGLRGASSFGDRYLEGLLQAKKELVKQAADLEEMVDKVEVQVQALRRQYSDWRFLPHVTTLFSLWLLDATLFTFLMD